MISRGIVYFDTREFGCRRYIHGAPRPQDSLGAKALVATFMITVGDN